MTRLLALAAFCCLGAAAVASLFFVYALQPTSVGAAAFFAVWLVLPYALLALTLVMTKGTATAAAAILVAAGGVLFVVYVVYVRPDPQGAIAVFLTPVYQAIGFAVLLPACRWLLRGHDS